MSKQYYFFLGVVFVVVVPGAFLFLYTNSAAIVNPSFFVPDKQKSGVTSDVPRPYSRSVRANVAAELPNFTPFAPDKPLISTVNPARSRSHQNNQLHTNCFVNNYCQGRSDTFTINHNYKKPAALMLSASTPLQSGIGGRVTVKVYSNGTTYNLINTNVFNPVDVGFVSINDQPVKITIITTYPRQLYDCGATNGYCRGVSSAPVAVYAHGVWQQGGDDDRPPYVKRLIFDRSNHKNKHRYEKKHRETLNHYYLRDRFSKKVKNKVAKTPNKTRLEYDILSGSQETIRDTRPVFLSSKPNRNTSVVADTKPGEIANITSRTHYKVGRTCSANDGSALHFLKETIEQSTPKGENHKLITAHAKYNQEQQKIINKNIVTFDNRPASSHPRYYVNRFEQALTCGITKKSKTRLIHLLRQWQKWLNNHSYPGKKPDALPAPSVLMELLAAHE